MELLDLCYDVLIRVLQEIDPADLASCARTSWGFNDFIKDNQLLYKAHYLKHYDDPRRLPSATEPDWITELQRMVKFEKILASEDFDVKKDNFTFVASTVETFLSYASEQDGESRNISTLAKVFKQPQNLDAIMYGSSLYQRAGSQWESSIKTGEDQQISAKLHCLHGMTLDARGRRSLSAHPYARSRIYDLRNYTDETRWGPFRDDGSMRVDWEMLESVMINLTYNSCICCPRFMPRFLPTWNDPFSGVVKDHVRAQYPATLPMEPEIPVELKDPYNISGIWHRIVCFLDYNDLYAFNFGPNQVPSDQPREPCQKEEAIRHIRMKLQVTEVKPPGKFDNQALPIVYFTGYSKSTDATWDPNANSRIRGNVRLTPEGEVRWTTISVFFGGEERWRSEGIQVGGLNSKRGVVGTWFDKDYDPHGPAGPTAFWKTSDKPLEGETFDEDSEEDVHW